MTNEADKPQDLELGTGLGVPGGAKALIPKESLADPITPAEMAKYEPLLGPQPESPTPRPKRETPIALVVDDDPAWRLLIDEILEELSFEHLEATNGADALRIIKDKRPNIVLLDLRMPVMDGFEVLRGTRNYLGIKDTFILVTSVLDSLANETAALELGADDFLAKPIKRKRLKAHLAAIRRRVSA